MASGEAMGGPAAVSVALHPLLGGQIRLSRWFLERVPGPLGRERSLLRQLRRVEARWMPVPAYLIVHPSEGPLLVDTAYDPSAASDPAQTMGRVGARLFDHRVHLLRPQLEALGHGDVGRILMTHLHLDHAGGLPSFPDAEVLADRREWRAATRRGAWLNGYHAPVLRAVRNRVALDLEGPGATPHGPFERTLDLFGDGSVRLLSTPGHSVGHLSLEVRTATGPVLLCADAAYLAEQLDHPRVTASVHDDAVYLDAIERIRRWRAEHPGRPVVPGHDPDAWPPKLD
jgi:N-acyl homoserine lactone hydrolase